METTPSRLSTGFRLTGKSGISLIDASYGATLLGTINMIVDAGTSARWTSET